MAICFYNEFDGGKLALWKISETFEELFVLANLNENECETFAKLTNPKRQLEWLAVRALLFKLLGYKKIIGYKTDHRPFLEDNSFQISISHTSKFVTILLNEIFLSGIDIEEIDRPVEKASKRFLSPTEMDFCLKNREPNKAMLLHWCSKEAVFKMIPFENIDFAKQIILEINEIDDNGGTFVGKYIGESAQIEAKLNYLFVEGVLLVWGLNEVS